MGFSTDLHPTLRRVIAVALFAMIVITPAGANLSRSATLPPADFQNYAPSSAAVMPSVVLDGNPQNVQIRFSDPPLEESVTTMDGIPYAVIKLSGEGAMSQTGQPDLPQVSRLIMIGNTGNVEVEVVEQSFRERQVPYFVLPAQHEDSRSLDAFVPPSPAVYAADEWYPPTVATISQPATLRDARFVVVTVYPVQVNPARQQMRVYDNIEVRIANTGGMGVNEIRIHLTSVTPDFKKLYRMFENFEGSALDALPVVPGKCIFICDSLPQIVTQTQKLVDWKRRKGIDASLARLQYELGGATTATQIQTYIANQYSTSNGQLEFVGIVGDATTGTASTWSIPTFSSELDNLYGMMSSGPNPDPLPDIAVGRLSVRNLNQLANLVNKIISYESNPDVSDSEWFTRGWCAAHTDYAQSNITTLRYSENLLLQHGFTTVHFDTFPGDMVPDTLRNRLTEGLSVFNHRMSWINEMEPTVLTTTTCPPTRKLPFVLAITCATGSFTSETTLSEKWIRPVDDPVATEYRGAIGCVGMSGTATHTRYNNILNAGMMSGMYAYDVQTSGAALIAGKLELYRNYIVNHPDLVEDFCHYANLMGDPSVPIWRYTPNSPSVTAPSTVPVRTNNVAVSVQTDGQPLEGALVALVKGSETFARGYTNASGYINLPVTLATTGNLLMTITHEKLIPVFDTISVDSADASLSYAGMTVNDNNHGDGNGVLNPGEIVDLTIQLQNTGRNTAVTSISGTLSTPMPGITILGGTRGYPNIAVGATAGPTSAFTIQVGAVFENEPIPFHLTMTSSAGTQDIRFDLTPRAADVTYVSRTIADANNILDPGETNNMTVTFTNSGSRALTASCAGILRSLDSHVTVNDSTCVFGAVAAGANGTNSSDYFNVTADPWTRAGYIARMLLVVTDETGFRDSTEFTDTVGTAAATSPTGPDAYGYYAYDDTETQPAGAAATYDWIEIYNNGGTNLNFHDMAENGDASTTVALPFGFKFYGEVFDEITICSNGWLAFG
ncbi:hypothetical protein EHM69_12225, partial [candidate division KSB1 bacterium]